MEMIRVFVWFEMYLQSVRFFSRDTSNFWVMNSSKLTPSIINYGVMRMVKHFKGHLLRMCMSTCLAQLSFPHGNRGE